MRRGVAYGAPRPEVAIVTGTARGIGKAIAGRFPAEVALVMGIDLLADLGAQRVGEVAADRARRGLLAGDISQEPNVRRIYET